MKLSNKLITDIFSSFETNDVVFFTDSNVYSFYKSWFSNVRTIVMQAGEENKNIDTALMAYEKLIQFGANRNTLLVCIGGGVVTDVGGFIASTYMRGIRFGFVSTTLLGMIDASIGGKNGFDFNGCKNIIGTFNNPEFVYWSTEFLNTLSQEEIHNGFGELLKYAIGFDSELFDFLNKQDVNEQNILNDQSILEKIINRCQKLKINIVNKDEKEKNGLRKKLNLGHTIGHMVESETNFKIKHGIGVALGIATICDYSAKEGYLDDEKNEKIQAFISKYKFSNKIDGINIKNIDKIYHDKKMKNTDTIDLVIVTDIGKCEIIESSLYKIQKFLLF